MSNQTSFQSKYDRPRRITVEDFHQILKAQDVDRREDLEFICPACGTVQTAQDLIDAGAGEDYEDVATIIAFSCVGRYDEDVDCDWTLGGLLQIHDLEVVTDNGDSVPRMLPVNFEEAMEELRIEEAERTEDAA